MAPALKPTIVVADDESHIRLVVGEKFRSEGYTVVEARDGEEALELVRARLPGLLVTDLQMPYMNGLELCIQLAADARTSVIPALLLTARGHIVEPAQLAATIIRKVMAKPFSVKSLFENATVLLGAAAPGQTAPLSLPRTLTGEAA
jgi:CheY-like chemotaxis protein